MEATQTSSSPYVQQKILSTAFELRFGRNWDWAQPQIKLRVARDLRNTLGMVPVSSGMDPTLNPWNFVSDTQQAPLREVQIGPDTALMILTKQHTPASAADVWPLAEIVNRRLRNLILRRVGLRIQRIFLMPPALAARYLTRELPGAASLNPLEDAPWQVTTLRRLTQASGWTINEFIQAAQQVTLNVVLPNTPGAVPQQSAVSGDAGFIWDIDLYQEATGGIRVTDQDIETAFQVAHRAFAFWEDRLGVPIE
jgi:hypothetical protein